MFAGEYPPKGWMFCEGQYVSMDEYAALFAVVGSQYGVDAAHKTFALPDLRETFIIKEGSAKMKFLIAVGNDTLSE